MPEITRKRTGEFMRIVFDMLLTKPEGLSSKVILEAMPAKIQLTGFEKGFYPSDPNSPRYEKIIRFATIAPVKAGWMVKSKGNWSITEVGKQAYKKYIDPEVFFKEAVNLYHTWKKTRTIDETGVPEIETVEQISLTVEEAEEKAWQEIKDFLQRMNPYDFQDLVADLLKAMDYHISWVSPPGKDRGIDIIAYTDPLGASVPRIKVQVKRRDSSVTVEGLRAFLSVLGNDDVGLFVSSGGFTSDAKEEARTVTNRKITLLDLEGLYDLWVEHYNQLSQEAKQRFPLKPIYFLALID
jgi:restriction system protein